MVWPSPPLSSFIRRRDASRADGSRGARRPGDHRRQPRLPDRRSGRVDGVALHAEGLEIAGGGDAASHRRPGALHTPRPSGARTRHRDVRSASGLPLVPGVLRRADTGAVSGAGSACPNGWTGSTKRRCRGNDGDAPPGPRSRLPPPDLPPSRGEELKTDPQARSSCSDPTRPSTDIPPPNTFNLPTPGRPRPRLICSEPAGVLDPRSGQT